MRSYDRALRIVLREPGCDGERVLLIRFDFEDEATVNLFPNVRVDVLKEIFSYKATDAVDAQILEAFSWTQAEKVMIPDKFVKFVMNASQDALFFAV